MAGYTEQRTLLDQGFFYGYEYMKALVALNQKPRCDWFLKKGSFYHGFTSSKCFEMTPSATSCSGIVASRFVLKRGATPCQALDSLNNAITFIGCGEIIQVSEWQALREVLGDDKFNLLFAADSRTPLIIHWDSNDNALVLCLTKNHPVSGEFHVGQAVHFANIKLYGFKHVNGEAGGYNALCIDATPRQERFVTLGLDATGMRQEQVRDVLYREFNAPPVGMSIVTPQLAARIRAASVPEVLEFGDTLKNFCLTDDQMDALSQGSFPASLVPSTRQMIKDANCTFEQAKDFLLGCGSVRQVSGLDMERIHILATTTTETGRALLDKWYIERRKQLGL
jgi:hypothetical protein